MTIFRKLQQNARVHRERINQENFSVMLGVNIGGINKELAIARVSVSLFKVLIVEVGIGSKDVNAKVGSRSAHSFLRDKTGVSETIVQVDYLPCRRSNKCVVLLLTLTYIHVGGDSPESTVKIVCNREAESLKRLDMTDLIHDQGGA